MNTPQFSIFTSTRNSAPYVKRCIESIKAQKYADYECIFIDDASEDDTYEQARAAVADDPRFVTIRNGVRRWQLGAYLQFLNLARGQIIVELDGDDWFSGDNALNVIARTYADTFCDATVGSYVSGSGVQLDFSRPMPEQGRRLRDFGFMFFAPRTWTRKIAMESFQRDKDIFRNPRTGESWRYVGDKAFFSPIFVYAPKVVFIKDILYVVNTDNPNRDIYLNYIESMSESRSLMEYWYSVEALLRFKQDGTK